MATPEMPILSSLYGSFSMRTLTVTMLKPIQRPRMPPEFATNQIT